MKTPNEEEQAKLESLYEEHVCAHGGRLGEADIDYLWEFLSREVLWTSGTQHVRAKRLQEQLDFVVQFSKKATETKPYLWLVIERTGSKFVVNRFEKKLEAIAHLHDFEEDPKRGSRLLIGPVYDDVFLQESTNG